MRKTVQYLGHVVSQGKVAPDPQKIKAVQEWPISQNIKHIQAFLGLANYYRRFVYRFSHIATPLTNLTKEVKWQWGPTQQQAFDNLKTALTSAPVLRIYDSNLPICIEHNASDFA
jgi:hypothetical protein